MQRGYIALILDPVQMFICLPVDPCILRARCFRERKWIGSTLNQRVHALRSRNNNHTT